MQAQSSHSESFGLGISETGNAKRANTARVFDYAVSARGLSGDVEAAMELAFTANRTGVVDCVNPHSIVVAKKDSAFRKALLNADILLPDGAGVVLAAKVLGNPVRQQVAGTEFFLGFSQTANRSHHLRYFFLGSTFNVLRKIQERLGRDFPNIDVCDTLSPPFREAFSPEENRRMVERVNDARPDVVWVGMTAPKQEKWIEENRDQLDAPLVCAIGAVFDFYSGETPRSPKWAREHGLEWLPRLIREPRRLWRRNFISTPIYLADLALAKLHQKVNAISDRVTDSAGPRTP